MGDTALISQWEADIESSVTPLLKFHSSWSKVKEEETRRIVARTDEISDTYDFIPKLNRKKKDKRDQGEEFKGIFGDDEEDSSDDDEEVRKHKSLTFLRVLKYPLSINFRSDSSSRRSVVRRGVPPATPPPPRSPLTKSQRSLKRAMTTTITMMMIPAVEETRKR